MAADNIISLRLALAGTSAVNNALKSVAFNLAAIAGAAVSVRTLINLGSQAVRTADEMGKLAQKTGIAVAALSSLSFSAELGDVKQEELQSALKELSKEMVSQGRESQNLEDRLLELSDIFASMPDGPQKVKLALDNFGRSGMSLIPFLNQGSEAIRRQRMEADALGLTISQGFAQNADTFNDNLFRLKQSVLGIALQVADRLLPVLIELQERFIAFTSDLASREALITGTVELFKRAAMAGLTLKFVLDELGQEFFRQRGTPQENLIQQSRERRIEYNRLMEALGKAGEEQAETQQKQNTGLRDFINLATKAETLRALLLGNATTLAAIRGDGSLTRSDRNSRAQETLSSRLKTLDDLEKDLQSRAPKTQFHGGLMSQERIAAERELNEVWREQAEVRAELQRINEEETFGGRFQANIRSIVDEWGNAAVMMADTFKSAFTNAVDSISNGISGLILQTMTWREALTQIYTSIVTNIVQGIVQMGVRWVATQIMMAVTGKAILATATAATIPLAAAQSAIWATPATLATIASYGGAAAAAPGLIAAAEGIVKAQSVFSSAGFMQGGYTGAGPATQIAGPAHRGEFIFTAPQTRRIGVDNLEAIASGSAAPTTVQGHSMRNNIVIVRDRSELREYLKSAEGRTEVLDIVRNSKLDLGIS